MRIRTLSLAAAALTLAVTGAIHAFQEGEMPAPAGPGKQHELLKHLAGEWTATMSMSMPGMPSEVGGTEVNELTHNGLWVVGSFKMPEFMGMPFSGTNLFGWDAEKEKYVGVWIDSGTQRIATQEGDYDEASKTLTMWNDGRNPMTGEPMREKQVMTFDDDNTRTFSMLMPGPEGEFVESMKIVYKRKR